MKKIELSLLIGLLLAVLTTLLTGFTEFGQECGQINEKLLRLHVIANSDSNTDQQIKLAVRDKVLEQCGDLLWGGESKNDAKADISAHLPEIEAVANRYLAEQGCTYTAQASIENRWFNTRIYNEVTLPAGNYDALCIRLGKEQGQNWWCVVFPPMCLPSASEEEELAEILTEDELRIVTEQGSYIIRFKLWEIYQRLINDK